MKVDILVAEIGSTTTIVNAFNVADDNASFIGGGAAPTSVLQGDVQIGLTAAVADLSRCLSVDNVDHNHFLATSSAAGGLRMTIHGLIYDMTVKAGKEAALGAGANIHLATAGKLTAQDLTEIDAVAPNLILLAGGTDYGDRETALNNADMLCRLESKAPVIYCGNVQNQPAIKLMFTKAGRQLYITENVYPRLDELNIEPVRALIHRAFEDHITEAPGMAGIRDTVGGTIMPTPGAVMAAARLLHEEIGDLLVVDVGGATTDVHSVTEGSEEIAMLQISPEPMAKRTVEGDLGMYVNARNLAEMVGLDKLSAEIGMDALPIFDNYLPVPQSEEQLALTTRLAYHAASIAIIRHCGTLRHTYGASGRQTHAVGKDLTAVRHLVATGGALTRLPGRRDVLQSLCNLNASGAMLYPKPGSIGILEDSRYIMASIGVLSRDFPDVAKALLRKYVNKEG
ncbi:MAG: GlmL-related ornithine degradation protein [Defluviitaleaceae bacterium]|nr:GlmL-related ornithine degradation protein [Defluviitaleaceae bacterium]